MTSDSMREMSSGYLADERRPIIAEGLFIYPPEILTSNPDYGIMRQEIYN
jgi:hypothetical protein